MGDLGSIPAYSSILGCKESDRTGRLYCEALCFTYMISFEPHDNPKIDGYHSHLTDDETVGSEIVNDA